MKLKDLKSLSKEYSISVFALRKFVKSGLPHFRLGRKILVKPEEFEDWFMRFRVDTSSHNCNLDEIIQDAISKLE